MNKENRLIALYLLICDYFSDGLSDHFGRLSNNSSPLFTDEEVVTIYLFGLLEDQKFKLKDLHRYIQKYWLDWFPKLPTYSQFNKRVNRLAGVFPHLVQCILNDSELEDVDWGTSLGDSMPIIMAQKSRSYTAKVALELCNRGYCSSKKLSYHGVKLHALAFRRPGKLPLPEFLKITPASEHDLTAMREIFPYLRDRQLFLDKAYCDQKLAEDLQRMARVTIHTPVKRKKGQADIGADGRLLSTAISRVRQPIESFFNWLEVHTEIQYASRVRSTQGIQVHVFGRLAAAMILFCLNIF
ncbi:MAG: transposase [Bacteroidota bacterium]